MYVNLISTQSQLFENELYVKLRASRDFNLLLHALTSLEPACGGDVTLNN